MALDCLVRCCHGFAKGLYVLGDGHLLVVQDFAFVDELLPDLFPDQLLPRRELAQLPLRYPAFFLGAHCAFI